MRGIKHDFLRQRAFSSAISCANLPIFTKHPTPDPSSAWHPWIGRTFRVHGVFYRNLTAWSSDWYMDADSTPGHMPNLRAAGRLMPVARASDGVPLCLLGKHSRIARPGGFQSPLACAVGIQG